MIEVLSRRELVARAGTSAAARRWLRAGLWQPVMYDAYVCGGEDVTSPTVRAAAAARVLPPEAALSHRASLWVLGEDVLVGGVLDVTVPRGQHLEARPGLRPHTAALPDDELVLVDGLLVVSAARSVLDVMRSEPLPSGVAFGDRALRTGAASKAGIASALDRCDGLRGVLRARTAVPLFNGRAESWRESLLRVSFHLGGLRDVDVQFDVYDADGHVARADLHVEGAWFEYDGRAERLLRSVFEAERRRQTAVSEMGFEVRRFTALDVPARSPASLVAEARRAIALAAGRDRGAVRRGPDTLRPPRMSPLPTVAEAGGARTLRPAS